MKLLNKYAFLSIGLLISMTASAQSSTADTQTDLMSSNGKIYVVMAVVVVIVIGLFLYLVGLDRKISKLEKKKE
jgi:CcmD family protein